MRYIDSRENEEAIYEALNYLKQQLKISGSEIASWLHVTPSTVNRWLKKGRVSLREPRMRETLPLLLGIHQYLGGMFLDPFKQKEWLMTAHPFISGGSPAKRMQESFEGLKEVFYYLLFHLQRGS